MQETRVWSLDWEDSMEKEMTTQSSILAWEIHGQRILVGYSPRGCKARHDCATKQQSVNNTNSFLSFSSYNPSSARQRAEVQISKLKSHVVSPACDYEGWGSTVRGEGCGRGVLPESWKSMRVYTCGMVFQMELMLWSAKHNSFKNTTEDLGPVYLFNR